MKITEIYKGDKYEIRTCDDCDMPCAIETTPDDTALYSVIKHTVMETKLDWNDQASLGYMRARHEENGTAAIFDAALRCIRCTVGLTLVIGGQDTQWQVGGDKAVGQ